uniref:Uncharacterized protein n=1 Tax=Anguilla anguilla TaxID=7936 RepID=A0A0E9T580_ANGAN
MSPLLIVRSDKSLLFSLQVPRRVIPKPAASLRV